MPSNRDPLPSGVVNPSSGAPGNAYGHCKDNGNGHPNQQPAGCTTDTLAFEYAYDERGLISQRDVVSDEATTRTSYVHDDLGRLSRSVTGGAATIYVWDAASNLVGEGGTDDPSTSKVGDAYAIARTVNAANELVTLVKNPVGTPGGKVATTQFTYDARGNRTGAVTTTQTGNKTHVESTSTYVYDSMDQLTSTSGLEGSASFGRDGVGRALTVTEDGVTSNRLYDGFTVVADGATQLATAPNGQVLSETTTTTTTKGKTTTTSVATVDVLTDVLGSAVATASAGVISADLQLFGDFGELLTTPKTANSPTATVTGFTGKLETAGLVEFASRTYDPATRVWVQDDRYRGTVTRAASMNRYAYVEGAPESFVDVLGFYRARAALEAQRLATLNAAFQSALEELQQVVASQARLTGAWTVEQMMASYNMFHASDDPVVRAAMDQIAREAFYAVTDYRYQQKVQVALAEQAAKVRQAKIVAIQTQYRAEQEEIQEELGEQWLYNNAGDIADVAWHGVVNFGSGVVNALGDTVDFVVDVGQTTFNAVSPSCWTGSFCAAIPDIPAIPVYGDPNPYQYSQMSGYATAMAAEFVLTGGVGALKTGGQVAVTAVKTVPRLVTELPVVLNEVKTVVKAVVPAVREVIPLVKTALSGAVDDVAAIVQAPGEFLTTLRTGLNNPVTTPGGIFGTPATGGNVTPELGEPVIANASDELRAFRTGEGAVPPEAPRLSLDEARAAAEARGVDTSCIDLCYQPSSDPSWLPDKYGFSSFTYDDQPWVGPNGLMQVTLTDLGLQSSEQAAYTIAHELGHLLEAGPFDEVGAEAFAARLLGGGGSG